MQPEQRTRYTTLLAQLNSRWMSGRLTGLGVLGEPVRVYQADDGRALFVVSDVLLGLGYQNLSGGTAQHLRRCPVPIEKVRLQGKAGFPFASALDSVGVQWLIDKTRPRVRTEGSGEEWEDERDQRESVDAFSRSWANCLSHLPPKHPLKYPDLEAMNYTEVDKREVEELQKLEKLITAEKISNGARSIWELSDGFGAYIVCSCIVKENGPWNLKGKSRQIP